MKRLMILVLSVCVTVLFCVSVLSLSASGANTEIWNAYSLRVDENGFPCFSDSPEYAYTADGLRVTPSDNMLSYTVQTECAFSLKDGIFMEIKLDSHKTPGVIVFHMWDQSGMMLSNYHCGSGWQGLLQLDQNSSQYIMSAFIWDDKVVNGGDVDILGAMKVDAPETSNGGVTYTLEIRNGEIYFNGSAMVGSAEAMDNLKKLRPDGSVYFGVSVNMIAENREIPLTITRFGLSSDTATVPGMAGSLPDTGNDSLGTVPPAPEETESSTETDKTTEKVTEEPAESGADSNPSDDSPDITTESSKSPYVETEPSTKKDIDDENVDRFMEKLEKGCGSVMGCGLMSLLSVVAAAYVCSRKKN